MSTAQALRTDHVYEVLEDRMQSELRFRSAVITSTALHVGVTLTMFLAPLFIPNPVLFSFTPVNLVSLAPEPEPAPAPVVEEEEEAPASAPEPEPEPEEIEPPPPEDVPEDLEAQRIKEEEDEARRRAEEAERLRRLEEERLQREADEARRRRLEEERLQREAEEAARRAPQAATRKTETQPTEQHAERGVSFEIADPNAQITEEDFAFRYWLNAVQQNIATKWDPPARPQGSREILVVVHFRVDKNGRIIEGPDVRSSSTNRNYDMAAIRAVSAGQPFPPLPQAFRGNSLGINFGFRQGEGS